MKVYRKGIIMCSNMTILGKKMLKCFVIKPVYIIATFWSTNKAKWIAGVD